MAELHIKLELDEIDEAIEVFDRWTDRRHELPTWLRMELAAVEDRLCYPEPLEVLLEVQVVASGVALVGLSPRLRALVGNLRARG